MTLVRLLTRLAPFDAASVRRDALLAWVPLAPVLYALALRFGYPPLRAWLLARWGFSLQPFEPLLMSFLLVLGPGMAGMVVGFMLLDERDEGVLRALMTTPVSLGAFLSYRLAVPTLLGFALTLAAYPLAGLVPLGWTGVAACAALAALGGPLMALVLVLFAADKVAGFVVVKVANVVNLLPVAAFFLPEGARWPVGVVPTFWPLAAYWRLAAGEPIALVLAGGAVVNLVALRHLYRRLRLGLGP